MTPPVKLVLSEEVPIETREIIAWILQVGSFSRQDNAEGLVRRLQDGGYSAYIEEISIDSGAVIYRVRIGPLSDIDLADSIVSKLANYGVLEHRIVVN